MRKIALAAILAALPALALAAAPGDRPDPSRTPGAINPHVTQADIGTTICVHDWTKTIRPPAYVTTRLKRQQMAAWGYADQKTGDYEEDHLISLELGGAPADPKNLWPQRYAGVWGARTKDKVETALHRLVCAGKVPLAKAQHLIATDWIGAYRQYVAKH